MRESFRGKDRVWEPNVDPEFYTRSIIERRAALEDHDSGVRKIAVNIWGPLCGRYHVRYSCHGP